MHNIVPRHNDFGLERQPGIGYRVWSIGEDEVQINVEAEYAGSLNPDPENLKYNVLLKYPPLALMTPARRVVWRRTSSTHMRQQKCSPRF